MRYKIEAADWEMKGWVDFKTNNHMKILTFFQEFARNIHKMDDEAEVWFGADVDPVVEAVRNN